MHCGCDSLEDVAGGGEQQLVCVVDALAGDIQADVAELWIVVEQR